VASLGSIRNTEWLEGAGLATGRWGVACDAGCRVFDVNGVVTDSIFVAGDIARAPHVLYEYQFLALEHWDNAVFGGRVAAHNMVSLESDRRPHLPLPAFWSGQFGVNIKGVGVGPFADKIVITQGSVKERRFAAAYGRRGRIVAAVTFNHGKWLEYYGVERVWSGEKYDQFRSARPRSNASSGDAALRPSPHPRPHSEYGVGYPAALQPAARQGKG
jgi:3-phenylpropionate/trans-cinnamate dioxygenase ferredoxin reductase subunit